MAKKQTKYGGVLAEDLKIYRFSPDGATVFKKFVNKVSCGSPTDVGDVLGEEADVLDFYGVKRDSVIIVEAHGDSMEPDFRAGDLVYIDPEQTPQQGDTVLAWVDGEALIKVLYIDREKGKVRLVPSNKNYPTIELPLRSQRLKIQGVVKFTTRDQKRKHLLPMTFKQLMAARGSDYKYTKKGSPELVANAVTPNLTKTNAPAAPFSQSSILLHQLISGKKGKAVALAIYCAAQLGLITQTDYNTISDEFGDIGTRQNYNRYLANPNLFTELEIESTKSFLTQKS